MLREGIRLRLVTMPALRAALPGDLPAVLDLLRTALLPTDVEPHFASFVVAEHQGLVVGTVGLEHVADGRALLRSLVVDRDSRRAGLGTSLANAAIEKARAGSVSELFLLTTDAAAFFERLGFESVAHAEAPPAVRETREFSELCPSTARLMRLALVA